MGMNQRLYIDKKTARKGIQVYKNIFKPGNLSKVLVGRSREKMARQDTLKAPFRCAKIHPANR